MQELINKIKELKIGKNEPLSKPLLTVANLKLRQSSLPQIPESFAALLLEFNGLSNEGSLIFGAELDSTLFYDLVKYNRNFFHDEVSDFLILGYNEAFYLVYDEDEKNYKIVDRDDFETEVASERLEDIVPYLLHI